MTTQGSVIVGETRFRVGPNVHSRKLGDELVVLDFANGSYFALDPIGAAVWEQIERGASRQEMVRALLSRYDVSEYEASRDVTVLLEDLLEHALILVIA